jgi:hypothetical protein
MKYTQAQQTINGDYALFQKIEFCLSPLDIRYAIASELSGVDINTVKKSDIPNMIKNAFKYHGYYLTERDMDTRLPENIEIWLTELYPEMFIKCIPHKDMLEDIELV